MKKRVIAAAMVMMLGISSAFALTGCGGSDESGDAASAPENPNLRLATTTSTKDSGLLDAILPDFEEKTGYTVEVISVGSGEAMELGEQGEADVLLVHSPAAEKEFVDGGHADADGRLDVMYNDFVVVGPEADPAGIEENAKEDALKAFTTIEQEQQTFVSRADDSGTHKKELEIWEEAGIAPKGDWYVEAAAGMGDVITMTDEMKGYTLSDRATWLNVGGETELKIVSEKDPSGVLNNQYGVICVNPEKNENINADGAKAFQEWIVSDETQKLIGEYGQEEYGEALFIPNAK
ncbi:substrate-binding domain-containing protein [Zhenpiania hominis]|uniref:Extracellular solute-binding protein n=1 Tax=Zhenpiania hominis TaxID=2763644 RepID=A0A923NMF9_9FIRM|nr:substrate-binding domain-containing protein [Zhenpiania hominis]MBC6680646.1 extracellular solute-binding protein [Zhenpiania hominis]